MEQIKLVALGDGAVGKTCLLIVQDRNHFPEEYVPTAYENTSSVVTLDGKQIMIGYWDTAGGEDYPRLRPLCYPMTDIFLICFDITNRTSFENVEEYWLPELNHHIPDTPRLLVGCKTDLCCTTPTSSLVSQDEAQKVAKRNGMRYVETSALKFKGIKECFEVAMRAGLNYQEKMNTVTKKSPGFFKRFKGAVPCPPVMPTKVEEPLIEVRTSCFAEDWQKALESPKHSDLTFVVDRGSHTFDAHKLMVCSACKLVAKILEITDPTEKNQLSMLEGTNCYCSRDDINSGLLPGFQKIYDEGSKKQGNQRTIIELTDDVPRKSFLHVLQFLYSGNPNLKENTSGDDINNIIKVAKLFQLSQLETICQNIKNEEEFLNPSIGPYLNDETGQSMKKLFLNQPLWADIVEDQDVYAHKCVLSCRCEVMAAMFGGHFSEGSMASTTQVPLPTMSRSDFLALLEYLYTDHSPIEEGDSVGILMLANQFNQTRLVNLCELYIAKEVSKMCCDQIKKSEIDVIGLLLCAQIHNADQLVNLCRFFIASNYEAFKGRPEFCKLEGENKEYVEDNRWPPVSYLKNVTAKRGKKCSIM